MDKKTSINIIPAVHIPFYKKFIFGILAAFLLIIFNFLLLILGYDSYHHKLLEPLNSSVLNPDNTYYNIYNVSILLIFFCFFNFLWVKDRDKTALMTVSLITTSLTLPLFMTGNTIVIPQYILFANILYSPIYYNMLYRKDMLTPRIEKIIYSFLIINCILFLLLGFENIFPTETFSLVSIYMLSLAMYSFENTNYIKQENLPHVKVLLIVYNISMVVPFLGVNLLIISTKLLN